DRKVINKKEDDYTIAENFLNDNKISIEILKHIMFIIKNMSFSQSLNKKRDDVSKEFYVVQDADRLDALGAIGIARVFAFGGSRFRPLYDPTKKAQRVDTKENYKKMESSSFHHFQEKILLLKNLMNTKTAKKIAQKRHKYIKDYMRQFLLEWDGKR
ncbi:MAG: phosphohydrolase, partial [Patescibacteria group bacterium]